MNQNGSVIIIGGGIMGLSSAMYLVNSGWQVTIIDKEDFSDNCSYGNAGYVCPSHFTPLATPGIVKQGFKWMLNSKSPFYVQPRLNLELIKWGLKFINAATSEKVEKAAIPLRDLALISQAEYLNWKNIPGFDMAYEHKGLIEIFQTEASEHHGHHHVQKAKELGLEAEVLTKEQLHEMEPHVNINAKGAIYFKCDAHVYPNKLMQSLIAYLKSKNVQFIPNQEIISCSKKNGKISSIQTIEKEYKADYFVLASGSWSGIVAKQFGLKIPMAAGRGYSVTLENSAYKINYPSVLMEGRVALTPMDGNKIRFGGTMEITSHKTPPKLARVQGILDTVKRYYPEFNISLPAENNIWYGYRPCSADGLPYIGKDKNLVNLVVATGHAMIGLSTGAGTGKLVAEILNDEKTSINIDAFNPNRFN